jgi:glycosyltransferase involved in cell wall biosynthesis
VFDEPLSFLAQPLAVTSDIGLRGDLMRAASSTRLAVQKTGVLFVSSPERPGADTFIHALIMRGLDRSRFDVHVAYSAGAPGVRTPAFEALSAIPDLHLRPSDFGPSLSGRSRIEQAVLLLGGTPALASFAGLARYVRRHRIRILHSTDRPRDALSCVLLAKMTGAKSVIHVHVACADWMKRSVRWAMGQADALVGVSRFVARSLVDHAYPSKKTYAVLNAIDPAAWDYRLDPGPVRLALGIPSGAPVVACAARLFRGKGQDDVIRALAVIRPEFPDARLLIIGDDDRQAMRTSFTLELKAMARDLGVLDRVIFTGYRADMAALLAASDVFALPSSGEPFGLVFLEALAMKKPVVALDNGGTPEVVEHGASGLLSPPGDQAGLAANLLMLLRDPALRTRMGEYGRRQVEARFTPDRMARDTEKVYAALWSVAAPDGAVASR